MLHFVYLNSTPFRYPYGWVAPEYHNLVNTTHFFFNATTPK